METHQGAAYWVIGTGSFDETGVLTLTSQGYVTAAHEDLEMPAMAAEGAAFQDGGNGGAIMDFTVSGDQNPVTGATGPGEGFYPSAAYGRVSSTSGGLLGSVINIADLGESPQDGFTGTRASELTRTGRAGETSTTRSTCRGPAGSTSRPNTSSTRTACPPSSP